MSTNKLVSVIIPAYNHQQYVQEAIQSVIDQTYPDIELIVINDGSKDDTWNKILAMKEACEKRFVNVIFETQENQGTCITLNRLLALSSGEYIQLLASDDKLTARSTQFLYDFLSKSPDYALAVGKNGIIDGDSQVCYWDHSQNIVYQTEQSRFLFYSDYLRHHKNLDFASSAFGSYESLLTGNYIPNGYLIRKNIFQKTGLFTTKAPLEDYWILLQIAKYAKFKYIDEVTFYYRWHSSNTSLQTAKMQAMTKKTLDYEIAQVNQSNNSEVKKIVDKYLNTSYKIKVYFKIPYFIEMYKKMKRGKIEKVLNVLGYEVVIKTILTE